MPPQNQNPANAKAVADTYQANLSSRFKLLDTFDRFVEQTQYEGRPSFSDDTAPLLQRAPSIVLGHTAEAIRSHGSMICGHARFPKLTTHGDEDDTDLDQAFGLSKDDSGILDPFIAKMAKASRLQTAGRRLVEAALGCGTAVAVSGLRKGRLCVDTLPAKYCTPKQNEHGAVEAIELRFPFITEEPDLYGRMAYVVKLYRRTIDNKSDTLYVPALADRQGREPTWQVAKSYSHDFGFCPVVWWKCLSNDLSPAEIDGNPLHKTLLEELYNLDLARSQLHRAVITTLDPIMIEIGEFGQGFTPSPMVDLVQAMDGLFMGNPKDPANKQWGVFNAGRAGNVGRGRKRAPGMAYKYPTGSDVKLLTLPGDSMSAGERNVESLQEHICDLLHWRPIDPKTMQSTALSGRALHWLHKKQIDFDDELRVDFADKCLLPVVDQHLRMALLLSRKAKTAMVFLPGLAKVAPILERFEAIEAELNEGDQDTDEAPDGPRVWISPAVDVQWAPYFPPNEQDAAALNSAVRADYQAGLITRQTAVKKLAGFYEIEDAVAYLEELLKEPPPLLPATANAPADPDAEEPPGGDTPGVPSKPPVAGALGGQGAAFGKPKPPGTPGQAKPSQGAPKAAGAPKPGKPFQKASVAPVDADEHVGG